MACASYSRSRRWHPAEAALVIGPGTAPRPRPREAAWPAVLRLPERHPLSTTIVAAVVEAMTLFLERKRHLVGAASGATLEASAPPCSTMRWMRLWWPMG